MDLTVAAVAVPFVIAITEVVKRTVPQIPDRFAALVSIAVSFAWVAVGLHWTGLSDLQSYAQVSVVAGLMASGVYSAGAKDVIQKIAPTPPPAS